MSNELVVMPIQRAVERYNAVLEFTKTVMKDGKDYGLIPGTDKPTLLKPGAEKLCSLFNLAPEFILADEIKDFDKGLFYFRYVCRLSHNNELIATGEGSANNKEKKYRWRSVFANQATEEEKKTGRLETRNKKSGSGTYQVYVIENTEPFDLINTLQKMAQKRALIAATLIAANASEFYTQDVEDMQYIDGEVSEVKSDPVGKVAQSAPSRNQSAQKVPNEIITAAEWEAFGQIAQKALAMGVKLPEYDRSKMTPATLNGAKNYINQEMAKIEKAGK